MHDIVANGLMVARGPHVSEAAKDDALHNLSIKLDYLSKLLDDPTAEVHNEQ
jgi:hypothetical protein